MFGQAAAVHSNAWAALGLIVPAAFAAVASILAAYWARSARGHAAATNDATNHRHLREGPDGPPPKLYDLALDLASKVDTLERRTGLIEAWNDRWTKLPAELADADRLVKRLDRMNQSIDEARTIAVQALDRHQR